MRSCETNALCVDLHQSSSTTDWNSVCVRESEERGGRRGDRAIRAQETGWEREWCSDKSFTRRVCLKCWRGKDPKQVSGLKDFLRQVDKQQKKWHVHIISPLISFPSTGNSWMRVRVCAKEWWKFRNVWGSLSRQEGNDVEGESPLVLFLCLRRTQNSAANSDVNSNRKQTRHLNIHQCDCFIWIHQFEHLSSSYCTYEKRKHHLCLTAGLHVTELTIRARSQRVDTLKAAKY